MDRVPVIDVSPLTGEDLRGRTAVGEAIDAACREYGFFVITGHGVDPELFDALDQAARAFFARPVADKQQIAMALGGAAWRGWFPLGGELTSGRSDQKEGLYFGEEIAPDDPRVAERGLLHGPNLFPEEPAALRPAVLAWTAAMATLAEQVLAAMALGLGLSETWFREHLTAEPVQLFRVFRYPPTTPGDATTNPWGVGEHTDYGLLTLLAHDGTPGLEVHGPGGWTDVPATRDQIVCNLGDMLDRMTQGRYRSTAHRVRNSADHDRLSFPYFYDPSWDALVAALPLTGDPAPDDRATRWDGTSLRTLDGTYGEYLSAKVAKVFPALLRSLQ